MAYLLLALSVLLSTGRNLLSKNLSSVEFKTKPFFLCQGVLFLFGALVLVSFEGISFESIAGETLLFAFIYGCLLVLAQWFYTAALSKGNTALCSTVYSLGFILPTMSGVIVFCEAFSIFDFFGILCAVSAVIVSGLKINKNASKSKSHYFIPLLVAMLASGGLGIVQKIQQRSPHAEEKSVFLFFAFLLAAAVSFSFFALTKRENTRGFTCKKFVSAALVGVFFGCCNLLNTTLAGKLDSAIFFPTLNIGVIILSMLCGIVFFKEKIRKREIAVLLLGGMSILLLNLI